MKEALTPQVKVSVVMCTYNGEKYLREQIESILNQTCPVYELIIQDDRSTDRTVEIVREYQQKDSRVKLFVNEQSMKNPPLTLIRKMQISVSILKLESNPISI